MPVTLPDLRALLERCPSASPAMLRLPEKERTVEGLARAYLPRRVHYCAPGRQATTIAAATPGYVHHVSLHDPQWPRAEAYRDPLDLTDPGTAHGLLVALALGMGLDPGEGGIEVGWGSIACDRHKLYDAMISGWGLFCGGRRMAGWVETDWKPTWTPYTVAATVANEPDPIRALELAVRHVLEVG